jgi:hypothetical protein
VYVCVCVCVCVCVSKKETGRETLVMWLQSHIKKDCFQIHFFVEENDGNKTGAILGAMTFSITRLSIRTFSIRTFSISTLSIAV